MLEDLPHPALTPTSSCPSPPDGAAGTPLGQGELMRTVGEGLQQARLSHSPPSPQGLLGPAPGPPLGLSSPVPLPCRESSELDMPGFKCFLRGWPWMSLSFHITKAGLTNRLSLGGPGNVVMRGAPMLGWAGPPRL